MQHCQASEAWAVARHPRLGDEGIKVKWFWVSLECTDERMA